MLIVADENIAQVRHAFAPFGEVRTLAGRTMTAADVRDADALLVRSVTAVGPELLAGSRVRFVGSATIGTDHLDTGWLDANGIAWLAAPGSNATAVVEYVLSCLAALDGVLERLASGGTVGVIGLGNVGGRLVERLRRLGIRCIGYDPLLDPDAPLPLRSLEQVLAADVVCCHTPLTRHGEFPTFHMLDAPQLARLRPGAVLLNAGRGGAIDGTALAGLLHDRDDVRVVLDVWEHEPRIDRALLARVALGTPHIAGYSVDGKLAGTARILEACGRHFGWPWPASPPLAANAAPPIFIDDELSGVALLRQAIQLVYDVRADDRLLRERLGGAAQDEVGLEFDRLRKTYPPRREFAAVPVGNWGELCEGNRSLLRALGFGAGQ